MNSEFVNYKKRIMNEESPLIPQKKKTNGFTKGKWKKEEHERFLEACFYFKNDWDKILEYIRTRNLVQIRSHAQKYLIKICKKYHIKLSTKKFKNKDSKHLSLSEYEQLENANIDEMNDYDKNIIRFFNYYHREWEGLKDEKLSNALAETIKKTNIKFHTIKSPSIDLDLNEEENDSNHKDQEIDLDQKAKNENIKINPERVSAGETLNSQSANKNYLSDSSIILDFNQKEEIEKPLNLDCYSNDGKSFLKTLNGTKNSNCENGKNLSAANKILDEGSVEKIIYSNPQMKFNNKNFSSIASEKMSANTINYYCNKNYNFIGDLPNNDFEKINFKSKNESFGNNGFNYSISSGEQPLQLQSEIGKLINYNNCLLSSLQSDFSSHLNNINRLHNFSKEENVKLYLESKLKIIQEFHFLNRILDFKVTENLIANQLNFMENILSINDFFLRNKSNYKEYLDNCKYFWNVFTNDNNLKRKSKRNNTSVL